MPNETFTKRQLIIIDDDQTITTYNKKLAEHTGHFTDIFTFNSGESAIKFLAEREENNNLFDGTIIVDVYMKGLDGLEFLDEIDERELVNHSTQVLVLTGKNSVRSREKTETSSMHASFAIKPLTEELLLSLAQSHA